MSTRRIMPPLHILPPFATDPSKPTDCDEGELPAWIREGDIEYPFEDPTAAGDENKPRGNWSNTGDSLLAAIGFTFGLGNLWRFPHLFFKNGGAAYLVPYTVMWLVAGVPIFFMELALGQFSSQGCISLWKAVPLFQGIGVAMFLISCIMAIYSQMVSSWAIFYLFNSMKLILPWATCDNDWNSPNCSAFTRCFGTECVNLTKATWNTMPSLEYFRKEVLMQSRDILILRTINWQLAICLLIAWVIVFFCLFKSIKSSGKVVYVATVAPYVILLVLLVRLLTLPGSLRGVAELLEPRWHRLLDPTVWGDAGLQLFYSLSACTGGLATLASYNRFHNNVFRDVWIISVVDFVTSLLGSMVVFSAVGFVAYEMEVPVEQIDLRAGVHLLFVLFSEAISRLPVAQLYSVLYFSMIIFVVITTELFLVETVVTGVCDLFPERLRRNHRHVLSFVCLGFYMLGIPLCTSVGTIEPRLTVKAGIYWMTIFDHYTATTSLLILAFFECMAIAWVYGVDNLLDNIKWMIRAYPPVYIFWKILWKIVCPAVFLVGLEFLWLANMLQLLLTTAWLEPRPAIYDDYVFPNWTMLIGWSLSLLPVVVIILTAIVTFCLAPGSYPQRWRELMSPRDDWGPALAIHRAEQFPLQIPEARRPLLPANITLKSASNGTEKTNGTMLISEENLISNQLAVEKEKSQPVERSPRPGQQRRSVEQQHHQQGGRRSVESGAAARQRAMPSFDRETAI